MNRRYVVILLLSLCALAMQGCGGKSSVTVKNGSSAKLSNVKIGDTNIGPAGTTEDPAIDPGGSAQFFDVEKGKQTIEYKTDSTPDQILHFDLEIQDCKSQDLTYLGESDPKWKAECQLTL